MANLEDELGDIVSKARMGLGYSVDKLAAATGISIFDIENIEAYRYLPKRDYIDKLAQVLSLNSDKLADIAAGAWTPNVSLPHNGIYLENIPVSYGSYKENCYILGCKETHVAAVVDPGGEVDTILHHLSENELNLELILITHAHADHIGGMSGLLDVIPNARLTGNESIARFSSYKWEIARDGVPVQFGSLSIKPLYTPGHTQDSTCYLVDELCFVGDTLFAGSIGRPSTPQIYKQMLKNIRHKLLSLPEDTILLPGHGPAATVGEERSHNPFF